MYCFHEFVVLVAKHLSNNVSYRTYAVCMVFSKRSRFVSILQGKIRNDKVSDVQEMYVVILDMGSRSRFCIFIFKNFKRYINFTYCIEHVSDCSPKNVEFSRSFMETIVQISMQISQIQ